MLNWQDPLDEPTEARLKTLAHELRRMKSEGWSVVLSANEIIVRPQDRTAGKFSITFVSGAKCVVSFFSRELNYWNKSKYFDPNASLAEPIKEWMESAATEPLNINHADRQDTGSDLR
jgi:hypothetical protein